MNAMILAAGLGKRMGALTESVPKPLLLAAGKPLIFYQIEKLGAAGIKEIVINLSYAVDHVMEKLGDGSQFNCKLHFSIEQERLETGGGIVNALPLLGDQPFVLVSGDVWSDFDYSHLPTKLDGLGHLIMVDNPSHHPEGDFFLENQHIVLEGQARLTYANIGLYSPELFKGHPVDYFPLSTLLKDAAGKNQLTGEHYQGQWLNIDTPERLARFETLITAYQKGQTKTQRESLRQ